MMRCVSKCLIGSQFCGKHIRSKNPRMWVDNEKRLRSVIKIQKVWRGFMVRNLRKLMGNLKPVSYANTEDLVTFEDSPILDKFVFEENGKHWWFDIRTIYDWSYRSLNPTNPYTKEPLTPETLKRLRDAIMLKRIRNEMVSHDNKLTTENKFILVCQFLAEYGLDIHPSRFNDLTSFQVTQILNSLEIELRLWHQEKKSETRKNFHYLIYQYIIHQYQIPLEYHKKLLSNCLLYLLRGIRNNYSVCFMVASAVYRL